MNLNELHQNYQKMVQLRRNPPKKKLLKIFSDNKRKKFKNETIKEIFSKVGKGGTFLDIGAGSKTLEKLIVGELYFGHYKSMDIAPGWPGNPLTHEEHMAQFNDCVSYAGKPLPKENVEKLVSLVNRLEEVEDVRSLIPLLISKNPAKV